MRDNEQRRPEAEADGIIEGRNAVIEALRAGRFYWSQGPQLKGLSIENGMLQVKTSPVEKIFVTVEGRDSYKAVVSPRRDPDPGPVPPFGDRGLVPRPGAGQPGPVRRDQRLLYGQPVTPCDRQSESRPDISGRLSFYDS